MNRFILYLCVSLCALWQNFFTRFHRVQFADGAADAGAGVVIDFDGADVGDTAVPIKLLHQIGPRLVHVNRAFVHHHGRGVQIHLADDMYAVLVVGLDDDGIIAAGAQGNGRCGRAFPHVMKLIARLVQITFVAQRFEQRRHVAKTAKIFALLKRQFVRRAEQMAHHDAQIVRVGERVFRRTAENVAWVGADVLVQRAVVGHHQRHGLVVAPPGAARLLPDGGNRARVAGDNGRIQLANVDAQLQGVGGHHAANLPGAQAVFDLAALQGQVAAAIAGDGERLAALVNDVVAQVGQQQFHRLPGAGKNDGLDVRGEEGAGSIPRGQNGATAQPQRLVDDGRVVEDELLFAAGCAVLGFIYEGKRPFYQPFCVFFGISNGG